MAVGSGLPRGQSCLPTAAVRAMQMGGGKKAFPGSGHTNLFPMDTGLSIATCWGCSQWCHAALSPAL